MYLSPEFNLPGFRLMLRANRFRVSCGGSVIYKPYFVMREV